MGEKGSVMGGVRGVSEAMLGAQTLPTLSGCVSLGCAGSYLSRARAAVTAGCTAHANACMADKAAAPTPLWPRHTMPRAQAWPGPAVTARCHQPTHGAPFCEMPLRNAQNQTLRPPPGPSAIFSRNEVISSLSSFPLFVEKIPRAEREAGHS